MEDGGESSPDAGSQGDADGGGAEERSDAEDRDMLAIEHGSEDSDGIVSDEEENIDIVEEAIMEGVEEDVIHGGMDPSAAGGVAAALDAAFAIIASSEGEASVGMRTKAEFTVTFKHGTVKYYNTTKKMVAHCMGRGHGNCFLTRKCDLSDAALAATPWRGRPFALMAAWLDSDGVDGISQWGHGHIFEPNAERRKEARDWAIAEADSGNVIIKGFLSRERKLDTGEPTGSIQQP